MSQARQAGHVRDHTANRSASNCRWITQCSQHGSHLPSRPCGPGATETRRHRQQVRDWSSKRSWCSFTAHSWHTRYTA